MKINFNTVEEWIKHDPDQLTRKELNTILESAKKGEKNAISDLEDRFQGTLQFGTAGLRGKMGAGPYRMNRATVRRAAAGLIAWLQEKVGKTAIVVIGYDARHHSADFARDTAAIISAAGAQAILMPRALPTPLLAFAVRRLNADAGVMVTASHNPPQDNGYKVYLGGRAVESEGNGAQIVSPIDTQIAAKIASALPANEIPLADHGWQIVPESLIADYVKLTVDALDFGDARDLKIVYTPMHGVGLETMAKVFTAAGFTNVTEVPEQAVPDPEFPTVTFPNPEEAGALDAAIALGAKINADIVIASDPDADRCSAAVPAPDGKWKQLSGDEIGTILGSAIASACTSKGNTDGTLASSIVSSRLLEQIALDHGLRYETTLTGFKWIARAKNIIYGYEEAIGFCVNPQLTKDKDGISAALLLAIIAAKLKADGKTLLDELDRLAIRYGLYLSAPVTVRVEDLAIIPATMAKIRKTPPTSLAGSAVTLIEDLADSTGPLPPTDAVKIVTATNDRVIIRPSGTEPKVKCYLEVIVPVASESELSEAKATGLARLAQFKADMNAALKL